MFSDPDMVPFLTTGPMAKRVLVRYSLLTPPLLTPPAPSLPSILREAAGRTPVVQTRWPTWESVSHAAIG